MRHGQAAFQLCAVPRKMGLDSVSTLSAFLEFVDVEFQLRSKDFRAFVHRTL